MARQHEYIDWSKRNQEADQYPEPDPELVGTFRDFLLAKGCEPASDQYQRAALNARIITQALYEADIPIGGITTPAAGDAGMIWVARQIHMYTVFSQRPLQYD